MSRSCQPSAYCANFCVPAPLQGCCFNSCCKPKAGCNDYNHICCGCPCPCLREYGSTVYRPICRACCPPPPKVPSKCRCVPKHPPPCDCNNCCCCFQFPC